jgi:hypothetical protein
MNLVGAVQGGRREMAREFPRAGWIVGGKTKFSILLVALFCSRCPSTATLGFHVDHDNNKQALLKKFWVLEDLRSQTGINNYNQQRDAFLDGISIYLPFLFFILFRGVASSSLF